MRWILLLLCVLPVVARATEPVRLALDPTRTSISFHARTTFHDFDGLAPGASGSVLLRAGLAVEGSVELPTAAIRTGLDARDQDMRGPTYLDAARHSVIRFNLKEVTGAPIPSSGLANGTVTGTILIKGVEHELSAPVTYGWVAGRLEVSGSAPLDLGTFGIPAPVVFLVQRMDPVVRIDFILTFGRAEAR